MKIDELYRHTHNENEMRGRQKENDKGMEQIYTKKYLIAK